MAFGCDTETIYQRKYYMGYETSLSRLDCGVPSSSFSSSASTVSAVAHETSLSLRRQRSGVVPVTVPWSTRQTNLQAFTTKDIGEELTK